MCDAIGNLAPRLAGAQDRASPGEPPNFMGLAKVGLEIGVFSDLLYSVLLANTILGLYFLALALSRPLRLAMPIAMPDIASARLLNL